LRSTALTPAYGMAEATLAITGKPLDAEPVAVDFDAVELQRQRAVALAAQERLPCGGGSSVSGQAESGTRQVSTLVGCGLPLDGTEVLIVDPDTRRPLEDNRVGEIWVCGPAVASGYWQQDGLSQS